MAEMQDSNIIWGNDVNKNCETVLEFCEANGCSRDNNYSRAQHAMNVACEPLILELAQRAKARLVDPPPTTDLSGLITVLDGFGYVIPHLVVFGRAIDAALLE